MARIAEHLSVAELAARFRAAQTVTEARHTQAIWLLAQGRTVVEVAGVLALTPRWVEAVAARYNARGPGGAGRWAAAERASSERADRGGAGRPGRAAA